MENSLVPTESNKMEFDEELCGVIVEKSKRSRKRKAFKKRYIAILLVLFISIITVKNFEYVKGAISSLFDTPKGETVPSTEEKTDTLNSSNNQNSTIDESNTHQSNSYGFIDTSPNKSIIINNFKGNLNIDQLSYKLPSKADAYAKYGENSPIVLIINFSPNESFSLENGFSYESKFHNPENNVQNIAKQICNKLNELGIKTLHVECENSSATLYESTRLYKEKIEQALKDNPGISYIFDISRALTISNDMKMYNEFIELNGTKLPTINLTVGTNQEEITETQKKAIFISNQLTNHINREIPNLVSCQTISNYELNQTFSVPTVRVEIGSFASGFENASLTAEYFSLFLSAYLSK